eukprot:scaffold105435_cov57-Phaeocystis_antarctica.AAC.1
MQTQRGAVCPVEPETWSGRCESSRPRRRFLHRRGHASAGGHAALALPPCRAVGLLRYYAASDDVALCLHDGQERCKQPTRTEPPDRETRYTTHADAPHVGPDGSCPGDQVGVGTCRTNEPGLEM